MLDVLPNLRAHGRPLRRWLRTSARSLRRRATNVAAALRGDAAAAGGLGLDHRGGFLVAYRRGTVDERTLSAGFERDMFFSGVPEYRVRPDHTIVDIGAHIGTFALLAASRVPQGRVYAVEACRESYDYLRVNAALNRAVNLEARHLALAGEKGRRRLFHTGENWGHSLIRRGAARGEEVPADTLAGFLEAERIEVCHFLKCNAEGSEFEIFLSAPPEALRRIEVALILYHCDIAHGHREDELKDRFDRCGFRTEVRNRTTHRGWLIATRADGARGEASRW